MLNHTVLTMKDLKSGGLDKYHFEGLTIFHKERKADEWQGGACEILSSILIRPFILTCSGESSPE